MYVPAHFAQTDRATLHDFIERHSFGLLVSQHGGAPFATHMPLLLDRSAGQNGTLLGHVARANPHWQELNGQTALAIFSGSHAYISPSWYEAEHVVPTWNYLAVHAYGRAEVIEDRAALLDIVRRSVVLYEANLPRPWSFDEADPYVQRMLAAIVGIRLTIERLEGKWKLNQNHPVERRAKVVRRLRERGEEDAGAIAELMQTMLPEE